MSKNKKKEKRIFDRVKIRHSKIGYTTFKHYKHDACAYEPALVFDLSKFSYDGNHEYLEYKIHGRKPYNTVLPCTHIKNSVEHFPLSLASHETLATKWCSGDEVTATRYTYEFNGTFTNYTDTYRLPQVIPDMSIAHREALNFFASGCQPLEANFAVNLFEIGEIFDMIKNVTAAIKLLKTIYRSGRFPVSWRKFVRLLSTNSLKRDWELSGIASDAYLQYSFAIAPLIDDVKKLTDMLTSINSRIEWFKNNNKKPVPVRYTKDMSDACSLTPVSYPADPPTGCHRYFDGVSVTYYKATYKAFALATYDVSGLTNKKIGYRLLKKALGFSDPIAFLYETIPFSFVIDWFTNVGEYITAFDKPITFPYVLSHVGHSITVTETKTLYYSYVNTVMTPSKIWKGIHAIETNEYYKRLPEIPVNYTGLELSPPTLQQLSLALALGRSLLS